jgi:hypothetical protein
VTVVQDRFRLQVQRGQEWVELRSGEWSGWMQDEVSRGEQDPSLSYRIHDSVVGDVLFVWHPDSQAWTEVTRPHAVVTAERLVVHQLLHDEVTGEHIPVALDCDERGITLSAPGHGDACSSDGHGSPVHIEFRDGELWVRVWSDIHEEDPTSICLAGARESRRDG